MSTLGSCLQIKIWCCRACAKYWQKSSASLLTKHTHLYLNTVVVELEICVMTYLLTSMRWIASQILKMNEDPLSLIWA